MRARHITVPPGDHAAYKTEAAALLEAPEYYIPDESDGQEEYLPPQVSLHHYRDVGGNRTGVHVAIVPVNPNATRRYFSETVTLRGNFHRGDREVEDAVSRLVALHAKLSDRAHLRPIKDEVKIIQWPMAGSAPLSALDVKLELAKLVDFVDAVTSPDVPQKFIHLLASLATQRKPGEQLYKLVSDSESYPVETGRAFYFNATLEQVSELQARLLRLARRGAADTVAEGKYQYYETTLDSEAVLDVLKDVVKVDPTSSFQDSMRGVRLRRIVVKGNGYRVRQAGDPIQPCQVIRFLATDEEEADVWKRLEQLERKKAAQTVTEELLGQKLFRTWLDLRVVWSTVRKVCPGEKQCFLSTWQGDVRADTGVLIQPAGTQIFTIELVDLPEKRVPHAASFADIYFAATPEDAQTVWRQLEQLERQHMRSSVAEGSA